MTAPRCTCSKFSNAPDGWCEKHGDQFTEADRQRLMRCQDLFYKTTMEAIVAIYRPEKGK